MRNSIAIYINTPADGRKALTLFKKLTGCTGVIVRAEGKTSEGYIHDQAISEDFKTIDFHQFNGMKKPLKFKDRLYVVLHENGI